jgi:N-acetylglucosamine-6-sulfatase
MRTVRLKVILVLAACAAALAVGSAIAFAPAGASRSERAPAPRVPQLSAHPTSGPAKHTLSANSRPNIVFVLTDDLSNDLLQYMPTVQAMQRDGLTFNDYFVSDSLCCPSRSSIFTGNFPHNTHVFGNTGREGGFNQFYRRGEEHDTFAVALKNAGYRTAMMGKFLNGYLEPSEHVAPTYVPPGWTQWDVAGYGYREFNYYLNQNGELHWYGAQASDYLTDVMARRGAAFIDNAAGSGRPFFLELATFAPHSPFVPAPRDASLFPGVKAPEGRNFDALPANAPTWLAGHPPLTATQIQTIDDDFRLRVQDVQSIDEMIETIESTLAEDGLSRDTYIVFSSDNGLHMGQYRLMPGKLTAFDTDIRVPLIIVGPGVRTGSQTDAMAENVDLAKTFAQIGGTSMSNDGHSLVPLFGGRTPSGWRNAILVEHHGPDLRHSDPDYQRWPAGNPTTYEAMRTHDFLYVEYRNGEREFYNLRTDPYELDNIADELTPVQLATLHADLQKLEQCRGAGCWTAMHVAPLGGIPSGPAADRSRRRAVRSLTSG